MHRVVMQCKLAESALVRWQSNECRESMPVQSPADARLGGSPIRDSTTNSFTLRHLLTARWRVLPSQGSLLVHMAAHLIPIIRPSHQLDQSACVSVAYSQTRNSVLLVVRRSLSSRQRLEGRTQAAERAPRQQRRHRRHRRCVSSSVGSQSGYCTSTVLKTRSCVYFCTLGTPVLY
jgi:hypothetical protein